MKKLVEYPRALVVQTIQGREVAWVKPFALVQDRYVQSLPEGISSDFGIEYMGLVAAKGSEVEVGDAFRTYNMDTEEGDLPKQPLIGGYLPGTCEL